MVTPVSVNPSSSTQAGSNAVSGGGDTSFYFGPNPNAAAVLGKGGSLTTWLIVGGVAAVLIVGIIYLRPRPR